MTMPVRQLLLISWLAWLPLAVGGSAVANESGLVEHTASQVAYVSLRNLRPEREPADRYGGQRSEQRVGWCTTQGTHLSWLRDANSALPVAIPEGYTRVSGVTVQNADAFWRELASDTTQARPVLYLHGYNVGFARGCRRVSQFQQAINRDKRVILFSWPSDGNPARYTHDEADIGWSEAGLAAVLEQLQQRFGPGGFDVIAHSLGSRAALRVAAMLGAANPARPAIGQLLFIASDVDAALFRHNLPAIRAAAQRVSVIANDQDLPLKLSRELHGEARLGEVGPHLDALPGADVYDLSALGMRGSTGHLYHLNHPDVQALIRSVLVGVPSADIAREPIRLRGR